MPLPETVTLNTGAQVPTLGLGTWKSKPTEVVNAVKVALANGYRHIDTAAAYGNEAEVGQGIRESGVPRSEIFLTTKLDVNAHRAVAQALETSLQKLDVGYIDLWLMHWPAPRINGKPDKEWDWLTTWKHMEDVFEKNKERVRAIGVSNFSQEYLERLLKEARVVPATNQIELHPALPQPELRKFCVEQNIVLTAYSPLGSDNSPLLKHDTVKRIADAHSATPAQVLISYQVHKPLTLVIPKSVTAERIISNGQIVELTKEEVAAVDGIYPEVSFRACDGLWTGWGHLGMEDVKAKLAGEGK